MMLIIILYGTPIGISASMMNFVLVCYGGPWRTSASRWLWTTGPQTEAHAFMWMEDGLGREGGTQEADALFYYDKGRTQQDLA